MKAFLVSCIFGCLLVSCKAQDQTFVSINPSDKLESVEYQTYARSGRTAVIISPNGLTLIEGSTQGVFNYPKADWDQLKKLVASMNLKDIDKLKAPSNKRFSDGAASASITLVINGKTKRSAGFDHGQPPEELKALVTKVLSIAEKAQKP